MNLDKSSVTSDLSLRVRLGLRAVKRSAMRKYLSGTLPLYLVPEFPKSGGTWFSQMLADCLDVPFYRNTSYQRMNSSVMSGHFLYDSRYRNVVVMFRDGRDVIVSAYYYFLFKNEINANFGVARHRGYCRFDDYDDIQTNLPKFIEYMFTDYAKGRRHFSWSDFVDSWIDEIDFYVTYRQLRTEPVKTMDAAIRNLTGRELPEEKIQAVVDKYSFKRQTGRAQGDSCKHSFARKGIVGDWVNHFSPEAREVFAKHAGKQLIRLGFEKDLAWVNETASTTQTNGALMAEDSAG
jgi:hypothetical protein